MKQMKIDPDSLVSVDFGESSEAVRLLKPVIFRDGDAFCCLLGPDQQAGVFGCGPTAEQAVADWDNHLTEFLASNGSGADPLWNYILGKLNDNK